MARQLPSPDKFKTVRFMHNNSKSGQFGGQFQQDIEPAGFYFIMPDQGSVMEDAELPSGWTRGTKSFHQPLVIELNSRGSDRIYDEYSWKAQLYQQYKAKGRALTKKLLADGYDAIITITFDRDGKWETSECVDLTAVGSRTNRPGRYILYHGTAVEFKKFNPKMGNTPVVWFASDRNKVLRGDVGAKGKGFLITAEVMIQKPAGWKEYNNLVLGQIKRDFDGVILHNQDGTFEAFVWDTKQIKIKKIEQV